MTIKAFIAVAAVGSMFAAGAAFAQDVSSTTTTVTQTQTTTSQSWDPAARTNYEATVLAEGDQLDVTAQTPASQNVAATVDEFATPTVTTQVIASAPVPDTPANRARYGQPLSHAGKMTAPRGN